MKLSYVKWMMLPLALAVAMCVAVAYGQEDMEQIDNWYFDAPRRPAAVFAHDEHNDLAELEDCTICHHVYEENGQKSEFDSSEDQACVDCHALTDEGPVPGLRKAFHYRCKGCHETQKQGPVTCAQCHVKS